MSDATIAAVSSPRGKGGVAVLRVSGPEAFSVCERIFAPRSKRKLRECPLRYQIYGDILSSDGKSVLDDGLATCFAAPHSFTGEDVVELSCHGGEVVTAMVLESLLESGASLAAPGEFSRRALMNGKLSLTAAEGIADLLDAKTKDAALLSSKTVRGKLSEEIGRLSEMLLAASASLWAYLDYPEEDLQSLSDEELVFSLEAIRDRCALLVKSFQMGRAIQSGISSAIVGKPNVGKSSFFNRLLGEERAIVTAIPGTTRDVLEYPLHVGRVLLNLSDTAGVRRDFSDAVEQIGIDRALAAVRESELVFALFDSSRPFEKEDELVLEALSSLEEGSVVIPVLTKKDLPQRLELDRLPFSPEEMLSFEKDAEDLSELAFRVEKVFISDEFALREGRIITNVRQKTNLSKCIILLEEAIDQVLTGCKDLASLSLESALAVLLEVDGKSAGEKILDEVFSRFCIGK
ncbi:MAG: tRNA uridine-5-carboxymethylaminomethyl(34) synthesis GTPase MnmE [Clostridia bacterium]|nr:tRNA uridine-5-carboxymethylaminomethyl(34) synthesis GTPase MnmE [Clostridia bacterium]